MAGIATFEKVGFEQFRDDMNACKEAWLHDYLQFCKTAKTDVNEDYYLASVYENIQLPTRSTTGSAGYDFKAPFAFDLEPGRTIKYPTGVRCKIDDGWFLALFPRSSLGFKYRMQLDNSVGVIDSDYYFSDNEGHIHAKFTNDSKQLYSGDAMNPKPNIIHIEAGDGYMQGIFLPFGITTDDAATGVRNGGFGSTDRK